MNVKHFFPRLIVLPCAALLAAGITSPMLAYAENRYQTDTADFDIRFSKDGTATVTESWTVTYTSGSFTRFYKDIFNPGNQLEYIQDINILSCHINGTEAVRTDSLDRVDHHYFFEQSEPQKYTIHWFQAAQDETVHYDITYEIPNAVRLDEENKAEYCYRLIGANFPQTVGEVHTKIHFPDLNNVYQVNLTETLLEQDGNTLYGTAQNVSGVYKIRAYMDPKDFDVLQQIVTVQVPDGFSESEQPPTERIVHGTPTNSFDEESTLYILGIMMLFICGIPLVILITTVIKKFKAKKMLRDDPNCFSNAAIRIQRSGIPFVWYAFRDVTGTLTAGYLTLYAFYAEIMDLCMKGYCTLAKDGIYLKNVDDSYNWDSVQTEFDRAFIELLTAHFSVEHTPAGEMISFNRVKESVNARSKDATFYSDVVNWKTQYAREVKESPLFRQLSESGLLADMQPDFKLWTKYAKYVNLQIDVMSCFALVQRTGSADAYTMLQMMQNVLKAKVSSKGYVNNGFDDDNCGFFIYYSMNNYVTSARAESSSSGSSSGSGCSSCSSCSSCSGCGGGGAD